MPKRLRFDLTDEQRRELVFQRDHHPKACVRERCALVLKVAEGQPASSVAEGGLLKPRSDEMVRRWYWRYRRDGFAGLLTRAGQGRKPAFSPCASKRGRGARRAPASGAPRPAYPGGAAQPLALS